MKSTLTAPVTMLQWSFVRDDQPRASTALQIALALREEVCDLEKAGIGMIQIDEPALREGFPLKKRDWQQYLDWAVRAFRISASGVADETQIHTHMCYSEFNDILPWIAAMDADVIPDARLWVNPDCGLKTRCWPETCEALGNMVQAAQNLNATLTAVQENLAV